MPDQPRPIRVLHCLWSGETGGAERAVNQLIREQMRDPGLEPAILFAQSRGPYFEAAQELGCPVVQPELPSGHAISAVGAASRLMGGFDVHHFHSPEPLLMLASVRCRDATRIFTRRGGTTELTPGKLVRYLIVSQMLKRRFAGFTANTAHAARTAGDLFGIDSEQFAVVYNGVEFDALEPRRPAREVREELGIDPDAFVLGTAANLKAWKRMDRLITALAAIGDTGMRLLILGDGTERESLESAATTLGVRDRTIFAGVRSHVADYLQAMDAFSLPSAGPESFGNAAVEAMALRVPTIVFSDGGGLIEHIKPDETGFIVEDQAQLEGTICRLRDDHELRRHVGDAGSAVVRKRYTPQRAEEAYRRVYEAAMAARAG